MNMAKRDFKFDKRAGKYDDHFEGILSHRFYELLYRYTDLRSGDKVLDVGCGTGTILKSFRELEKIEGHGIDVEPEMLSVARRKTLNFLCRNINGEFFSSEEIRSRFERQGFRYLGEQKDRYARLVIFEKP